VAAETAETPRRPVARFAAAAVRAVLGTEWDPALAAVSVLTLISSAAFSTFWSYVGIWATQELSATPAQVGLVFLVSACLTPPAAWFGGHLSDRYGRKPVLACSVGVQSGLILSLGLAGERVWLGLGLVVLAGVVWAPGRSVNNAMVADAAPPGRRDEAYASVRSANNLGVIVGPAIAATLLLVGGWPAFLVGIAAMGVATCLITVLVRLPHQTDSAVQSGISATLGLLRRDRPFLLFLLATLLGFMVYMGFETVLPIIAVQSLHLSPATWGFVYAVNPLLVLLLQVRLIRWTAAWPRALMLSVGVLSMGLPFLLLLVSSQLVALISVVVVFAVGEMLWVPTMQALISQLAPAHLHGAYMGGYTSGLLLAWMIAPLTALQVHSAVGERGVWPLFAVLALLSAAVGAAAMRSARRDDRVSAQ
jgi:MFS family permease